MNLMKYNKLFWLAFLVLTLMVTGCSKEQAASGSVQAGKENAAQDYELNVGYAQSLGTQLGFLAEYKGYFKEQNLKVNFVPFAVTADGLNALQTGKIDIGMSFGTAGPLTFISKGSDFSIIGGHLSGGTGVFAKTENKDRFKTIQDYKGKKIGTLRLYTGDIVLRSALNKAGIDWKKDVELTEFKSPSLLLEAIKSGKVDVGVGGINQAQAEKAGLVAVTWTNDLAPEDVCCRIVANTGAVHEKKEAYKRFLKAIIKAEKIRFQDPKETVTASKQYLHNLDEETINKVVIEPHQWNYSDPNKKAVEKMWNDMKKIGYITEGQSIDIGKHVDIELYRQALKEVIAENPNDGFFKKLQDRFNKQNL
jgi:NitT/TauT family transport system substrate-binding protein